MTAVLVPVACSIGGSELRPAFCGDGSKMTIAAMRRQTVLQIEEQQADLYNVSELFSSATGSYWGTRSEPYWVPPVKKGSCYKIRFQTGSSNPTSLTLTIPELENLMGYGTNESPLSQLPTLYPG